MATQVLGALDIGTQNTVLAAGEVVDGQLRILHVVTTPTYGVKKGDGMYLAPEDRILVW